MSVLSPDPSISATSATEMAALIAGKGWAFFACSVRFLFEQRARLVENQKENWQNRKRRGFICQIQSRKSVYIIEELLRTLLRYGRPILARGSGEFTGARTPGKARAPASNSPPTHLILLAPLKKDYVQHCKKLFRLALY